MTPKQIKALMEALARIEAKLEVIPNMPDDAAAAAFARQAAQARGFFWTHEFASAIGRQRQFVSDRCRGGQIRVLPGGKPWRIPLQEETEWNMA